MRSAQLFTVLAILATSVSSASIALLPQEHSAHRRHAAEVHASVLQARGARQINPEVPGLSLRAETAPRRYRKRGLNQRRCAAKTTTSSAAAEPTTEAAPTSTPEPEPTTSSVEPATTKTKAQTTTKATKTSTSAEPTATSDDNDDGSSSSGGTFTGQGTFYAPGLGSCGETSSDTDLICAVSQSLYDGFEGYTGGNPNNNPICGRKIKATYEGKSVTVTVVDRCVGCALRDLDFSPTAFNKIADPALGRLNGVTWSFV